MGARCSSTPRQGAGAARVAVVLAVALAWPAAARAEAQGAATPADAWLFIEAWRTFRYDLDASLPGEHGGVQLVERLRDEPAWVLRDGLRLAASPRTLSFLARRAARRGDPAALPALRQALARARDAESRLALERAMVELGDEATMRALEARLHDGSPQERREAAAILAGAGPRAVPTLEAALEDPDVQTGLAAAAALAGHGHRAAQKRLQGLLARGNPFQRLEAAHALARAGDERALPLLRHKLAHPGGDAVQVVRSLGLVGTAADRDPLVAAWAKLPRGRSVELRRELLVALGRIAVRTSFAAARPHVDGPGEAADDGAGLREAWLEAIGWASASGARDASSYAARLAESVAEPFAGETPVAHRRRRERVERLLAALAGRPAAGEPAGEPARASAQPRATLVQWLRDRTPNDAGVRGRRFDAAVALLAQIGERLGHGAVADPPEAAPAGLGVERAVDGNLLTAWVAGPMTGTLQLELPTPVTVSAIRVINGCVDSEASYRAHARIRTLTVRVDGGHAPVTASLVDGTPAFQRIALPGAAVRRIALEVTATWPGERPGAPACLPELRLE